MTNLPRLPRVMTHVFPAASEYDQDHRRRVQQRKVVFMSFGVTVAAALIAFFMKSTILFTRAIHSANLLKHKGFEVIEQVTIKEIEADAIVYRHKKTRTDVMTIVPRDTLQDSVFGISFRTLPTADNGAIHVLQRSILDGSVRYPVKDPIHELRKGSLQTYMNAETFEDRTLYSAASRNQQDFANLVSVHLDAVFNPMCVRKEGDWIFRQEGWRLERVDDQTRDLNFNGNTYNDMMGIYGDPDELIKRYGRRALFGDTHYGFDAQGEPDEILSLTQKDINDTYDSFYHPTNAQVFFYGPIDTIKDSMDILDSHLRHYKPRFDLVQGSTPAWQPKDRKSRVEEVHPFPSSHNKDNYQVVLSWLLNDEKMDYQTELKWKMIEQLLVGTPTAAISAALLNHPVVGSEVIGGLDTRHQQAVFSVGLKGVKRENVLDVEERITNSLERVKKNGAFTSDLLAGALNTLELEVCCLCVWFIHSFIHGRSNLLSSWFLVVVGRGVVLRVVVVVVVVHVDANTRSRADTLSIIRICSIRFILFCFLLLLLHYVFFSSPPPAAPSSVTKPVAINLGVSASCTKSTKNGTTVSIRPTFWPLKKLGATSWTRSRPRVQSPSSSSLRRTSLTTSTVPSFSCFPRQAWSMRLSNKNKPRLNGCKRNSARRTLQSSWPRRLV